MPTAFYRLDLTPHQRAALFTAVGGYIAHEPPVEVAVDATTGEELEISTLLTLLIRAEPTMRQTLDEVIEALRPVNGQVIDQRLLDQLPGGRVDWRVRPVLGFLELSHRDGTMVVVAETQGRGKHAVRLDVAALGRLNAGRR